jgi:hypothetical protein
MKARLRVSLLGLAALAACASSGARAAPDVRLLSQGSEPRRELRYSAPVETDATFRRSLVQRSTLTLESGGERQESVGPEVRFELELEARAERGGIAQTLRVIEVGLTNVPDESWREELAPVLAVFEGLTGEVRLTARGVVREARFAPLREVGPEADRALADLQRALSRSAAPLPAEAVGPGARWEVASDVEVGGLGLSQLVRTELVGFEPARDGGGERVRLAVEIEQRAGRQALDVPGRPSGSVWLIELEGRSSGTVVTDLRTAFPLEGRLESETRQVLSVPGPGAVRGGTELDSQRYSTGVRVETRFEEHPQGD